MSKANFTVTSKYHSMTRVVIILDEAGYFQSVLTDSEINAEVLRRGEGDNDNKIDSAEQELEEVTV